jgi:hypothetical protein
MPRYVVLTDHRPDTCPLASKTVRKWAEDMSKRMPEMARELGVTMVQPPLHLDPGHQTVAIVDADSIETVSRLVFDVGLAHFNTVQVFPATPVSELTERVADLPTLYD